MTMKEIDFRAAVLLESLGEPIRYLIIRHLQTGAKAVGELARLTRRHQTTVCQHLAILRHLNVVRYHNRGPCTFYELKLTGVTQLLDSARELSRKTTSIP